MSPDFTPSLVDEVSLDVRAWGAAQLTPLELAATRKQSFVHQRESLTPRFLKHSDDQTLASLAAIFRAINTADFRDEDFADWSIISASMYLGRQAFARVLAQYPQTGPWGVPVHVIPNCTPHAISATIGVGLGCHGPTIGVNGGMHGELDSFLSAACLLTERNRRGVWIVLSGWCPEPTIDEQGEMATDSCCQAVALALQGEGKDRASRSFGAVRFSSRPLADKLDEPTSDSLVPRAKFSLRQQIVDLDARGLIWRQAATTGLQVELRLQSHSRASHSVVAESPPQFVFTAAHAELSREGSVQ